MKRSARDLAGYIFLLTFLLSFFFSILVERSANTFLFIVLIIVGVFLSLGLFRTYKQGAVLSGNFRSYNDYLFTISAAIIGGVSTYVLNTSLQVGPVLAASLVGVAAAYLCPRDNSERVKTAAPIIYCGTFVGMSSPLILDNLLFVAFASALAGLTYILVERVYVGTGGKLGTMAFVGSAITIGILRLFKLQ